MLRIAHVVESFGGGTYQVLRALASAQATAGHDVLVVYSDQRGEHAEGFRGEFAPGIRFERLPMVRSISPRADLRALLQLTRLLRRERPDVVHLHSSKAGAVGRAAAAVARVPAVVYTPHGVAYLRRDVSRVARAAYRAVEWLLARLPGAIVAVSPSEAAALGAVAPARRIRLVHNGMDLEPFRLEHAPVAAEALGGALRIGTAGRITAQKGPALFVELCRRVLAARDDVHVVWIGDGPERATLERDPVVARRLTITGWLSPEDTRRAVAGLDVLVQTSLWEGLPMAVTEAMLLRRAAVVHDIPGNRDAITDGRSGIVAKSADELAAGVLRLLADPALRERMGVEAEREARERHGLARMVASYEAVYRELLR